MQVKSIGTAALVAGAGAIVAVVAAIALKGGEKIRIPRTYEEAIDEFVELQKLLNDGKDSDAQRKAVLAGLKGIPDEPRSKALRRFAERDYPGVVGSGLDPSVPFHGLLAGSALLESGKRAEASAELKRTLEQAPPGWPLKGLVEAVLRRAEAP